MALHSLIFIPCSGMHLERLVRRKKRKLFGFSKCNTCASSFFLVEMQVPTIEKSHSSPGSSKSSSEGHLRSHGPSRSQSKTSVTQTHLEDAGAAIAAAEAAVQQLRLQPSKRRK